MTAQQVTQEELQAAYQETCLPESGVSFDYCMETDCVKTCLKNLAISMRKRTDPAIPRAPKPKYFWQQGQYA